MAPEYGATIGFFPVDNQTLDYLKLTGREPAQIDLVERYCKEQCLWRSNKVEPVFTENLQLDLSTVIPSVAGPRRPQDRVELRGVKQSWESNLVDVFKKHSGQGRRRAWIVGRRRLMGMAHSSVTEAAKRGSSTSLEDQDAKTACTAEHLAPVAEPAVSPIPGSDPWAHLTHGDVVIAAITSCTNTSNPSVMVAAGLLAKKAVEKGLTVKPYVKTSSLARQPGRYRLFQ